MSRRDSRYSVRLEWTGDYASRRPDGRMWVARFCGEWIGSGHHAEDAGAMADAHRTRFLESLPQDAF